MPAGETGHGLEPLTPLSTVALFPGLHASLIELLRGLKADEWLRPTRAGHWRVRDVATHLLDGDLRRLSGGRDGHRLSTRPLTSFHEVVTFINSLNADGVSFGQRLSPRVIIDLLALTGPWISDYVAALPLEGPAVFAVDWAGEGESKNWMDIGREFTERWHHQMQIREAVDAEPLLGVDWLQPILGLSVRAFRRSLSAVSRPDGTAAVFAIRQHADLVWTAARDAGAWNVYRGRHASPNAAVTIGAEDAWRLLYNGLPTDAALSRADVTGDPELVTAILNTRSVMV